jgi:thermitase
MKHVPFRRTRGMALATSAVAMLALALGACSDRVDPSAPVAPDLLTAVSLDASLNASLASGIGDPAFAAIPLDGDGRPFAAGQILVRFTPGAAADAVARDNRGQLKRASRLERLWVIEVPEGEELELAARFARNPNVEFAQPDYALMVMPCGVGDCVIPNDPFFGLKWDLHNSGSLIDPFSGATVPTGLAGADMRWIEAREHLSATGVSGSARIAILDTGIRHTHDDLAGKVVGAQNFALLYATHPDFGPGFVVDRNGHGTHVAGIAAATGDNTRGVAGIGWLPNVQLLNAKVCEFYSFADGSQGWACFGSSQVDAIMWAVQQGANVLNLSLGGPGSAVSGDPAVEAALNDARANNVLPFCASGNNGFPGISFPARFASCVAVGATTWSDARADYSNHAMQLELSAPGGGGEPGWPLNGILAPYVPNPWNAPSNSNYAWLAGTSMATPQAAGLAGLLFATGMTDAEAVLERMKATADDLGDPGRDPHFGYGRISVYGALTGSAPAIPMHVSTRSTVQLNSRGLMQVTLLARDGVTFSLAMLDLASIRLGSTPVADRPNGRPFIQWTDVDRDGVDDLVLHFDVPALRASGALSHATTSIPFKGRLNDGRAVRGMVSVRVL